MESSLFLLPPTFVERVNENIIFYFAPLFRQLETRIKPEIEMAFVDVGLRVKALLFMS